ncbi:hypothetical protein [Streptomyces hygroscopicus]|nr:hypothetical protein [Streptomyces hygroscopicus]
MAGAHVPQSVTYLGGPDAESMGTSRRSSVLAQSQRGELVTAHP